MATAPLGLRPVGLLPLPPSRRIVILRRHAWQYGTGGDSGGKVGCPAGPSRGAGSGTSRLALVGTTAPAIRTAASSGPAEGRTDDCVHDPNHRDHAPAGAPDRRRGQG